MKKILACGVIGLICLTLISIIAVREYPQVAKKLGKLYDLVISILPSFENLEKVEPIKGKIAFACSGKIYVMDINGSNLTEITEGNYPSLSHDGKKNCFF